MDIFPEKRAKGFTLIELLVVVSIIALLLSIMMPALGRARKQAQELVCKSNMRQIVTALHLYLADNEDRMPLLFARWDTRYSDEFGTSYGGYSTWYRDEMLGTYINANNGKRDKSKNSSDFYRTVYYCPVNRAKAKRYNEGLDYASLVVYTTYSANVYVQSYIRNNVWHHASMQKFRHPSDTPFMMCDWFDECYRDFGLMSGVVSILSAPGPSVYDGGRMGSSGTAFFMPGISDAHGDKSSNFSFLDGHAETVKTKDTWEEYQQAFYWQGHNGRDYDW